MVLTGLLILFGCQRVPTGEKGRFKQSNASNLNSLLDNSLSNYVMVTAHRGDWRHAPENSIQAVQNSINMGVDIVEIDVRMTSDSVFILMHDETLNRTTNGFGFVKDQPYDSVSRLYLKNGLGHITAHKVPTLKEVLNLTKDKVLVNLDKCYDYFEYIYPILKETGTSNQVIIKGYNMTYEQVNKHFGDKLEEIHFMPIVNLDNTDAKKVVEDYFENFDPIAFEFVFSTDTASVLNDLTNVKKMGSRVWINSLWPSLNAGHHDDSAVKDVEGNYGWIVDKGANIIQSDRPALLIRYLEEKGLRKL